MKTRLASLLSASLLACALTSTSFAQLIVNGSFEANYSQGVLTTTPTAGAVSGWTLATSSGAAEYSIADTSFDEYNFPDAASGTSYLALNVNETTFGVARVYQDFATVLGTTYNVSFTAGRGSFGEGLVGIEASAYDVVGGFVNGPALASFVSSGSFAGSMFYGESSFSFVATGASTRLSFADISFATEGVDALLDNVSVSAGVSAIPEPSTYAVIAGALTLGAAVVRRRQQNRKTEIVAYSIAA